ncbi:DsbA family oxidoreductase [Ideonella sp. DXS22W]|uniref:DsbA family oxidoreductase n=1 Tax=Pseudaquabacterium inlustre TaxID=2984192 RepID=A0ABU9CFH0_9BURK
MTTLQIDFVSDVVCPWCAVGLASLQQALARLAPEVHANITFQPFELNPQMPAEGEEIVAHLSRKYGIGAEQIAANSEAIRQRGAAVGFSFGQGKRTHIYNTFDAHRLLHWAGLQGEREQTALKMALLRAYHGEGRNPSDTATLVALAGEAGLDTAEAARVLASGEHAEAVRQAERRWQESGISSVPAVVIEGQYLVSGGQPPEVFEQALRQIAASNSTMC